MTEEKIIDEAVETWNSRIGNGTMIIPPPLDSLKPIYKILPRLFNRSPTASVVIVVDDFSNKETVNNYLTQQNNIYDAIFKRFINSGNIKILSIDWISDNINQYNPLLTIIYNPSGFTFAHLGLLDKSTFKLIILGKTINSKDKDSFCSICPIVKEVTQDEVDSSRTNPPVEEYRIPISIDADSEDAKLLEYYNDNIRVSINIFGGLENLKKAMSGTSNNNSAMAYCDALARDNGWSEHLDMTTEYNQQIDKLYNPIAIQEKANVTYDMIRKRSKLVASYLYKINAITEIVRNNVNKKILIINKFADMANYVAGNLNIANGKIICKAYYDKLESIPAVDIDGNPIFYKTGAKKGQRKVMGVTSQKKLYQTMFNKGDINVLSVTNSPDKELNIDVDIIIITSPLCEDIKSYLYRLSKINFNTPIILYTLYCKNTLEEKQLENKSMDSNHKLISVDTPNVKLDVNSNYIVVD